jgi:glycine oxidase
VTRPQHVVVVGAGLLGCAIARQLAKFGCSVTVLEKAVPGAESSSAAAGILGAQAENSAPGPQLELGLRSRALWPRFAAELAAESGLSVGYREQGLLQVLLTESELAHALERRDWMQAQGLRAELLTRPALLERQPGLADAVLAGLWLPDDHAVDPPSLVAAAVAAARACGARIEQQGEVRGLVFLDGRVTGVQLAERTLAADAVVIAAGAWTDCVPDLPPKRADVLPIQGQLALLQDAGEHVRHTLMREGVGYLVPRAGGRVVAGATMESRGFDKRTTVAGLVHVLGLAVQLLPVLAEAQLVSHWAGLRPQSSDGRPLMGRHPSVANLHLASGHFRNGILLAPVTAEMVAAGVLGAAPDAAAQAFAP